METKLKETEQKLDKLVNGFLDETIEKSAYLKKKEELIKLKTELIQKKSDFGQKGKLWLEPLRNWVETAHSAEQMALSNDFTEIKRYLEKVGTNHVLIDILRVSGLRSKDDILSVNTVRWHFRFFGNLSWFGIKKSALILSPLSQTALNIRAWRAQQTKKGKKIKKEMR